jgi:hypothetical protein
MGFFKSFGSGLGFILGLATGLYVLYYLLFNVGITAINEWVANLIVTIKGYI